jgi:hypothetical protein
VDEIDLLVAVDPVDVHRRFEAKLLGELLQLGLRAAEDDDCLDVGAAVVDGGVGDAEPGS